MKQGYLSQYFKGVAAKKLSAVEADAARSNQHEFNGVSVLKDLFGTEKRTYEAKFIYLSDNDDEPVVESGFLTWYDARAHHPTRTEYRMYFPTTSVSICAAEGDMLFIGLRPDDTLLVIITENGSTIGNQLQWLFAIENTSHPGFSVREELESEQDRIEFASRFILEQLGVDVEESETTFLDEMLTRFDGKFPTTRVFSEFARSTLRDLSPLDDPDIVLMSWMEREEILFRTLERYLLADRLNKGFEGDVDGFLKFSLSVQNRRKSRVGQALENHVEQLFMARNIRYERTRVTENKSKPDFIFPGSEEYHKLSYDAMMLTMLGVKSTCKDRWRQVLSEAARINNKHLLTLETSISENQTQEMQSSLLQLVVPRGLHATYSIFQKSWLMSLSDFVKYVLDKQNVVSHSAGF
jgi:hypothetical protein